MKKEKDHYDWIEKLQFFLGLVVMILLIILMFHPFTNTTYDKNKIHELNESYKRKIEDCQKRIKKMDKIEYVTTSKEVKKIVKTDKTNRKEFNLEVFNCADYSFSLVNALLEKKIYSCVARLDLLEGGAHSLVSVNTSDNGIIYVEPQDDKILDSLRMGDDYCKKVNWDCNWTISRIRSCFL